MTPKAFHAAAMALPGATFDIKWGADRVYSVGGKMFAAAGAEGDANARYSFKTSDMGFEMLTEQGIARPAPTWPAPSGCSSSRRTACPTPIWSPTSRKPTASWRIG